MRLEDQVCSLELAKRLRELGVKQESLFWWVLVNPETNQWELTAKENSKSFTSSHKISAFTVAELGEMLPWAFWKDSEEYWLVVERLSNGWWIRYDKNDKKSKTIATAVDKTETNARAKMLIYLLENKVTDLQEKL